MLRYIFAIAALISVVYGQADSSGGPFRIGPGISAPKPIRKPEPTYPPEARSAGAQGSVLLRLVVDEQRIPTQISVIRPLGYGLDERAIEAIEQWRFEPGLKNGSPVKVVGEHRGYLSSAGGNVAAAEKRRTEYNRALELLKADSVEKESPSNLFRRWRISSFRRPCTRTGNFLQTGRIFLPILRSPAISSVEPRKPNMDRPCSYSPRHLLKKRAIRRLLEARNDARCRSFRQYPSSIFPGLRFRARQPRSGYSARSGHCASILSILRRSRRHPVPVPARRPSSEPAERTRRDIPEAIAWLELSADQGEPQAKMLADRSRASLTPEQVKQVATFKKQLVHQN